MLDRFLGSSIKIIILSFSLLNHKELIYIHISTSKLFCYDHHCKKIKLKEVTSDLKKKFESKEHNNGLKKHFGKLKRNLDGLTYQHQKR